jgi:hypothetical protein
MLVVKARTLATKAKDQEPQGQGQGHDFLSSTILEAMACPRGLHHCLLA